MIETKLKEMLEAYEKHKAESIKNSILPAFPEFWLQTPQAKSLIGELVQLSALQGKGEGVGVDGKFRKKPVVIDAVQWKQIGDHQAVIDIPSDVLKREMESGVFASQRGYHPSTCGWIKTIEGGYIVAPNDWIITGIQGENYPCKPDIFEKTYEPATTLPPAGQPTGMRWVKASERLPLNCGDPWNHTKVDGMKVQGNFFDDDDGEVAFGVICHTNRDSDYTIKQKDFHRIEWLDETPPTEGKEDQV